MKYVRDQERTLAALKERPDGSWIATEKLTIQIPTRFRDVHLASIGSSVYAFGFFPIILDSGRYGLMNANAFIELGQFVIRIIDIGEVSYYEFAFDEGCIVFKTLDVLQRTEPIFTALNEFIFMGKIPWYARYDDIGRLFDTAKEISGTKANIVSGIMEFMAAYIARDVRDKSKFIRQTAKTRDDFDKYLAWVPMKSVYWSAPGAVNKLAGAYTQDGIVAELVNPSQQVSKVESILRA